MAYMGRITLKKMMSSGELRRGSCRTLVRKDRSHAFVVAGPCSRWHAQQGTEYATLCNTFIASCVKRGRQQVMMQHPAEVALLIK
jgi:3-deoxy-D-arabino-heptulosonate 7-phosphate (DAHP) synthase